MIDLGLVVGWAVVVAALGFALWQWDVVTTVPPLTLNLAGSAAVVVPLLVLFTLTEGGRYEASPGKQWAGLRIRRLDGRSLGYGRALLRNLIRIGLPWALAHAAVLAQLTARPPIGWDVWVLTGSAVLFPVLTVVAMLTGDHRAPHDIASHGQVVATGGARRVAEG